MGTVRELNSHPNSVVFYHASLNIDPLIKYLRTRKILVFHNITFPEFFEGYDARLRTLAAAGWYDISQISEYFERVVTFSEFSKECLMKAGWDSEIIDVLPIMVRFDKIKVDIDPKLTKKYKGNGTNLLFTGRICPNKKQDDIIRSFAEYKRTYNNNSRLFLIGGISSETFFRHLKELITKLGLSDSIFIEGHVSFSDYLAYYVLSDLYICLSEHEGFCIPLVEAMYFKKPIIAYDCSAIHDTMRASGILIKDKDPQAIARKIDRVVSNSEIRKQIVEMQNDVLQDLLPERLKPRYFDLMNKIIHEHNPQVKFKELSEVYGVDDNPFSYSGLIRDNKKLVICGMGKKGQLLYSYSQVFWADDAIILCDSAADREIDGQKGISILETAQNNKDADFVISVQNKRAVKEIMDILFEQGIEAEKIYIYDGKNNNII